MTARTQARGTRRASRSKTAREIALWVLYHVDTRKAFADLLLNRALSENPLEPRDAALATELVNGTLRWRARLDWVLARYVRDGLDRLPPQIRNVLRLGLYQVMFLDRVPPHAAVSESVKLARMVGHSGTAGLTNAVLRKILRDADRLPDPEKSIRELPEALSVAYSHPQWLVERWLRRMGEKETRAFLAADNHAAPMGLRANLTRTDRETLRRALAAREIEVESGRFSRQALRGKVGFAPRRVPEFTDGLFFVQDESETLVGELLGAEPGETVLDLCAAPGGKTTHVQEMRGSAGMVLAVDVQQGRLLRVAENAERLRLDGVALVCADGRSLALARHVDRVLVDAPCSGLGVLCRRADARWRKTEASMRALLPLERELLQAGAGHVRPGGVLVYSVCSTEPEETTMQVKTFLAENSDFELEDASGFLPKEVVTNGCLLLYPHRHGTDGAFAARFRRRS